MTIYEFLQSLSDVRGLIITSVLAVLATLGLQALGIETPPFYVVAYATLVAHVGVGLLTLLGMAFWQTAMALYARFFMPTFEDHAASVQKAALVAAYDHLARHQDPSAFAQDWDGTFEVHMHPFERILIVRFGQNNGRTARVKVRNTAAHHAAATTTQSWPLHQRLAFRWRLNSKQWSGQHLRFSSHERLSVAHHRHTSLLARGAVLWA